MDLVATRLFNPDAGYFRPCPESPAHLELDSDSAPLSSLGDRIHGYRFAGLLVALAARLAIPAPVPLNLAVLKFLLDQPITLSDLEQVSALKHFLLNRAFTLVPPSS